MSRKLRTTDITVLLDRSGSMESIKEDTEGGFNSFVRKQKEEKGRANLTLVQFDSVGIDTVYEGMPLKHVPNLSLEPRGMTPLLDAIGDTMRKTLRRIKNSRGERNVLFVIITDGLENRSKKWTRKEVCDEIEYLEDQWGWDFVYLGANQDAIGEARTLGIKADFAMDYIASPKGAGVMWDTLSKSVSVYRSAPISVNCLFTAEDKKKNKEE